MARSYIPEMGSSPRERGAPGDGADGVPAGRLIPARAGSTSWVHRRIRALAAHPRASGEHTGSGRRRRLCSGSSPRERGAPSHGLLALGQRRLIPARAGSTTSRRTRPRATTAHPRASGEHSSVFSSADCIAGSSPRERGAQEIADLTDRELRLIPARAGSTPPARACPRRHPAHPRASGEHADALDEMDINDGSSPRERGAQDGAKAGGIPLRLIPARAGSTLLLADTRSGAPAHPRASGEHLGLIVAGYVMAGSSPRERGARCSRARSSPTSRLIPARAGSTRRPSRTRGRRPAHPRASGEHASRVSEIPRTAGSSPRERGAPGAVHARGTCHRLIPARAGSTRAGHRPSAGTTAHPRASGEHTRPRVAARPLAGSSPRERGAPTSRSGARPATPAHPRASGEHSARIIRAFGDAGSSPRERGALNVRVPARVAVRLIPARAGSTSRSAG